MIRTRAARRAGTVTTLTAAGVLLFSGVAFAVSVYEGSDYASYSGGVLNACDMEQDGNGVYSEYRGPGASHGYIWDGNGSAAGCGSATVSVTSFRVCEDDWGADTCSNWVYL